MGKKQGGRRLLGGSLTNQGMWLHRRLPQYSDRAKLAKSLRVSAFCLLRNLQAARLRANSRNFARSALFWWPLDTNFQLSFYYRRDYQRKLMIDTDFLARAYTFISALSNGINSRHPFPLQSYLFVGYQL